MTFQTDANGQVALACTRQADELPGTALLADLVEVGCVRFGESSALSEPSGFAV
jgi:hypothetical protein